MMRKQRGITLLELLAGLAIIGGSSAVIISMGEDVEEKLVKQQAENFDTRYVSKELREKICGSEIEEEYEPEEYIDEYVDLNIIEPMEQMDTVNLRLTSDGFLENDVNGLIEGVVPITN